MKKRIVAVMVAILMLALALVSCSSSEEKIIGKWVQVGENNVYIFNEDGSGRHETLLQKVDITYEINGDKLIVNDKTLWILDSKKEYTFEIDKDTLRLTDGDKTLTFARQTETEE